jgi:hypothetical protein
MDEEARHMTKFLFDEGIPVKIIVAHPKERWEEDAISPFTVYYWVKQVRLGGRSFQTFQHPDESALMRLPMESRTDLQGIAIS